MQLLKRWSWVAGFAGVLCLVAAGSLWFVLGEPSGAPMRFAVAGAVALLVWAVLDAQQVGETVSSRAFVHGSGSSLLVVMAAAIAVGAYTVAREHDKTWDLSGTEQFTLSSQTLRTLQSMDSDVRVLAFFQQSSGEYRAFRNQIRLYEDATPHLRVEMIDPLRNPLQAEQHEITHAYGTVVFIGADGRERRLETGFGEEAITKTLVLLLSDVEHRICWSVGHGEPDPDNEYDERGLGAVVLALEALNYRITRTQVATEGIDRECEAFVVARPTVDWFPYEREALAAYVAEGGRALLLLEPGEAPELAADMARYGISLADNVVLDVNPKNSLMGVNDPAFVVLSHRNILPHPITANLTAAVVLGVARSVVPGDELEGIEVHELLRTSEQAWGETNPSAVEVQPDPGLELIGEIGVMVAAEVAEPSVLAVAAPAVPADDTDGAPGEIDLQGDITRAIPPDFAPKPGGRLVVVGDADFAGNQFLSWGNNRDLFMNSIAWLVEEEDQIGERPTSSDTLELTDEGGAVLCLISAFLVPGAAVLLAVVVLVRRRYL